jgi:hypothetical protein
MRIVAACVAVLTLAGASTPTHSPEAQAKLDKLLSGRVAGQPQRCVKPEQATHPISIDQYTLVFRDGPRLWLNNVTGSFECEKLDPQNLYLATSTDFRVCNGDRVVFQNSATMGACELGDFVPYKKP